MKTKMKSAMLRRARSAKMMRNYYFGLYLPSKEGMINEGNKQHQYN